MDGKLRPYLIEVNHLLYFVTNNDFDEQIKSRDSFQVLSIMKARSDDRHNYERKKNKECEKRLFSNEKSFNTRTPSLHATEKSEIVEKIRREIPILLIGERRQRK